LEAPPQLNLSLHITTPLRKNGGKKTQRRNIEHKKNLFKVRIGQTLERF
jgi:hypothetical protein